MATITGLTKERMLELEAQTVVGGSINSSGQLILQKHDGSTINAGPVVGPAGVGPTGSLIMYAGAIAPSGWFICDGSLRNRVAEAALFAVIGTTYGVGDGVTTFALPDMRTRVGVGRDASNTAVDVLGETGGAMTHILAATEMPVHTHVQNAHTHVQNAHTHVQDAHNHTQPSHNHTQNSHNHTQSAHSHNPYEGAWYAEGNGTFSNENVTDIPGTGQYLAQGTVAWVYHSLTANTTPTNVAATATNVAATATVDTAVATNQNATAVNQNATAVNQNAGGGAAHNNMQPYLVVNYIIKA